MAYGFLPDFGVGGLRIVYGFLPDVKEEAYGLFTDFYRMTDCLPMVKDEAYGLNTDF